VSSYYTALTLATELAAMRVGEAAGGEAAGGGCHALVGGGGDGSGGEGPRASESSGEGCVGGRYVCTRMGLGLAYYHMV
jgi:hypothetical protein